MRVRIRVRVGAVDLNHILLGAERSLGHRARLARLPRVLSARLATGLRRRRLQRTLRDDLVRARVGVGVGVGGQGWGSGLGLGSVVSG